MNLNQVTFIGRLTADPEKQNAGDYDKARFTLAVGRDFGKDRDETDFILCESWNQSAKFLLAYTKKGHLLAITGRLEQKRWQTDDGENRSMYIVVADRVKSLTTKKEAEAAGTATAAAATAGGSEDVSDIPF